MIEHVLSNITFTRKMWATLKRLKATYKVSSDSIVVQRALHTEEYFLDVRLNGGLVLIKNKDGTIEEITWKDTK